MKPSHLERKDPSKTILCPTCKGALVVSAVYPKKPLKYCIFCGSHLQHVERTVNEESEYSKFDPQGFNVNFIRSHLPNPEHIQFSLGNYQVISEIGRGGMGEVYLAYDTSCGRRIALKRIRSDLMQHKMLFQRFLKEARVTSQLTHPSIIPIYSIHIEDDLIYYTMPYVEGLTLKQLLRKIRDEEQHRPDTYFAKSNTQTLVRNFLSVCQAIAYAHSRSVLHRDIKPENILIGSFGEVVILDWGLAKLVKTEKSEESGDDLPEIASLQGMTKIGRVVGTLSYMAPERVSGCHATPQSDIYSLGVILYQILTLQLPFKRRSVREFRKNKDNEILPNPREVAPYRDVPETLISVVKTCLAKNPEERFQSVEELIEVIENFLSGKPDWCSAGVLSLKKSEDWEFQENVFLAEHTAITRHTESFGWVHLMISDHVYHTNVKLTIEVKVQKDCQGIGILLGLPEQEERDMLNEGFAVWLATEGTGLSHIYRSGLEVFQSKDLYLTPEKQQEVTVEKADNHLHIYIGGTLQCSYVTHSPLKGAHIGLFFKDANFSMGEIQVFERGQNVMVSCLALPDAFLANKMYTKALAEYRRIGSSFPGHAEGREALFHAGITLIEQAQQEQNPVEKEKILEVALDEFEKLHGTPGAPLEYLGKALVYEALGEHEEELKCFELGLRRFKGHPLMHFLEEDVIFRMHKSARSSRKLTYHFLYLVSRFMPHRTGSIEAQRLFKTIDRHRELLWFQRWGPYGERQKHAFDFTFETATCLQKSYGVIEELNILINSHKEAILSMIMALWSLVELEEKESAFELLNKIEPLIPLHEEKIRFSLEMVNYAIRLNHEVPLEEVIKDLSLKNLFSRIDLRLFYYLLVESERQEKDDLLLFLLENTPPSITEKQHPWIDSFAVSMHLKNHAFKEAENVFSKYPIESLVDESTPLYFLYGVWLAATEGKEISDIHFEGVLNLPYPHSWTLGCHYIVGKWDNFERWEENAFYWEKRELKKQLALYERTIAENYGR